MGISERREREKEQRLNSIIDAAERVFFAKGAEYATMDEVAEAAELSKGTLYLYFKNKEDLYHAIVKRGLEILLETFEEAVKKGGRGIDKIGAIGGAYFSFYKRHPDYFDALLHHEHHEIAFAPQEESPFICECTDLGRRIFTLLQEVVKEGIKDGSIRPDIDPLKLSLTVWGHSTGIMQITRTKKKVLENMLGVDSEEVITYSFELMKTYMENKHKKQK